MGQLGHTVRGGVVVTLMAAALLAGWWPRPAAACTCMRTPIAEDVHTATGVYIASPRLPDPWPGKSFRVDAVLKGPARANLRADVAGGGEASCGTDVQDVAYVLMTRGDRPPTLTLCSRDLQGPEAVMEAQQELGPGVAVPWRPDPVWWGSWALVVVPAAGMITLFRRRRERRRDMTS